MQHDHVTPLLALLRQCTVPQQHRLAELAGTGRNYLYQLSGCKRRPGVSKALAISLASQKLHHETGGATPVITVEEIASMCAHR